MIEHKLTDHVGTEFTGIDARSMSQSEFDAVYRAWVERCVVVLHDQHLAPAELVAFACRFGELEPPPASERAAREDEGAAEARAMWIISNVVEKGRAIGALGAGEAEWHSDMTYLPVPPTASILYGHEVPEGHGDTYFASMYAAFAEMPADLKARIAGLSANHDSSHTSAGELRKGAAAVTDVRQAPGAVHPLVIAHPETGRPALYPGRRRNAYIRSLELADSEALLDELWTWCTQPRFVYRHKWRRGDVVMWDNRATLHRRDAFDATLRRILWRCQVKGGALAAAAAA